MKVRLPGQGEQLQLDDGSEVISNVFTKNEMCTIYASLEFFSNEVIEQMKMDYPSYKNLSKEEKESLEESKSIVGWAESAMKKIRDAGFIVPE